ncbi:succinylglutamate desuccinylase/aspartoacylase family protein [bacterium]|nr:succinylglutamate desuccinylase/aspartoacylase family protein [bacterium]
MTTKLRKRKPVDDWFGESILPGETKEVALAIGESYSSMTVRIPIQIQRAEKEGPVVFVTAALHGDEINGTGAIRELIQDPTFKLTSGTVILVPVLNLLGFDRFDRYLPDRRDLNRSFPGSMKGSLASRMARIIFDEIVSRCDYGIDLHTAAIRRTNYPNVRGDLSNPKVRKLAKAFGIEVILNGKGPVGSFRREATKAGCPTIIMEGGEVWKVEPGIVKSATKGVKNVLRSLNMLAGEYEPPAFQMTIETSKWIRADHGGFMQFHISPGDLVVKGQPLITNTTLLGREHKTLKAPFDGIVIGMTSLPAIGPGEAVCNLGKLPDGFNPEELTKTRFNKDGLGQQVSDDLSSNMMTHEPPQVG